MLNELQYQKAHQSIINVLIDMKKHLDWYKEQDFYNEKAYKRRAAWITAIGLYIKASKGAFIALEAESEASYSSGIQRGKEIAENRGEQQNWRSFIRYSDLLKELHIHESVINRSIGKEALRKLTIEKAKLEQPELF